MEHEDEAQEPRLRRRTPKKDALSHNVKAPGVHAVSPALHQLILFDRAATARDMGALVVTDEHGESVIDGEAVPACKARREGKHNERENARGQRHSGMMRVHLTTRISSA